MKRPAALLAAILVFPAFASDELAQSTINAATLKITTARDQYYACVAGYAYVNAASQVSASDMAEAALASCTDHLGRIDAACLEYQILILGGSGDFHEKCTAKAAERARGLVLDQVVKARIPSPP